MVRTPYAPVWVRLSLHLLGRVALVAPAVEPTLHVHDVLEARLLYSQRIHNTGEYRDLELTHTAAAFALKPTSDVLFEPLAREPNWVMPLKCALGP